MNGFFSPQLPFFGETLHLALFADAHIRLLADCGCTGDLPRLEEVLRACGMEPETLTHLLLTHHDFDHMGAAAALKRKYPRVCVLAGAAEIPFIEGSARSPREENALTQLASLHGEAYEERRAYVERLRAVEPVRVDEAVGEGYCIGCCGGVEVLETPGHTPGHLSLLARGCGVVVSGDAAEAENGELAGPQSSLDEERARLSFGRVHALGETYDILCCHGGYVRRRTAR